MEGIGAIVADIGTFSTRVGFAGDDTPRAYFPTTIGVTNDGNSQSTDGIIDGLQNDFRNYHFDLMKCRENMSIEIPVQDGIVTDWDLLENLWDHALSTHIGTDLKNTPVLMTEKSFTIPQSRKRVCEHMFEKREVSAFFLTKDSTSSCYACGRTSGLIVDLGASGTTVSPVQDGFVDLKGVNRSSVGGRLMDAYAVHSILMKRPGITSVKPHYRLKKVAEDPSGTGEAITITVTENTSLKNIHSSYDRLMTLETGRDFKESISRMADSTLNDTDPKFTNLPAIPYELPDGTPIDVGIERFRCAELLIDPSPIDFNNPNFTDLFSSNWSSSSAVPLQLESLPKVIADSVFRSEPEMQPMLLANIMLTGGGACIDGITDRIKNELEMLIYHQMGRGVNKIKVTSGGMAERGALCAWLGGSILASLGSFHDIWISRAEYEEYGPNIIDRKCP